MVPDTSRPDTRIYGLVCLIYNVVGLVIVSCFIGSVVNAMDDFNALKNTAKRALRSIHRKILRNPNTADQKRTPVDQSVSCTRMTVRHRGSFAFLDKGNSNDQYDNSNQENKNSSSIERSQENEQHTGV